MSINFLSPYNIKGNNCYTCHVCGKSFQSPNPLKIHIATSCERQTHDMLWMRLHYIHGKVSAPSPIKHIPIRSAFEAVPIRFATRPVPPVVPQSTNAFEAAAQIETIVSNMGTSKTGHLCIYCGKVYSRKYGLKIHIRTHTGFKPLKCKFCFRPFGDPSNLNKHLRLHTQNESSHKCHLCNKVVSRRRDLQRHMETKHIFHQPVEIIDDGDGDVDDGEVINVDDDFDELSSVESD
uniref:C2H2-type domain-containing protein n=1 Tax=Megaselia scalaris TaxID=36166 RepID=T1GCB4_MEGSC